MKVKVNPKAIGTLTEVFCTSVLNLVILTWTGHKLSHRKAWSSHANTYTHTDTQTDAGDNYTWRPKLASGKNETEGQGQSSPKLTGILTHWGHSDAYMRQ